MVAGHSFSSSVFPFILRGVKLVGVDTVQCPIDKRKIIWDKFSDEWKSPNLDQLASESNLEDLPPKINMISKGQLTERVIVTV